MQLILHPKQYQCLTSQATEILYGGSAGGGKSYAMRVIAITLCYDVPGLQIYLFRRKYPDLIANHMNGSGSFPDLLAAWINAGICKINYSKNEIIFTNGSKIHLCHCQHEKDVINYQGAEIHVLLVDELTHFSEYMYRFLRNRVRLGGLKIPEHWSHKLPCVIAGSNPGSMGHQWVKRTFINYAEPYQVMRTPPEEGGMLRQYVPARLNDNPTLTMNDPGYADRLRGLGNTMLVKAMLEGDWDITAGSALERLNRERHIIRSFPIPDTWTKFMSIDWGTAKPYSIGWYTVVDDDLILKSKDHWKERLIAKGSIIRYREYYGWNGQDDTGCRDESWQVAERIAAIETGVPELHKEISDGKSVADIIMRQRRENERLGQYTEIIDYRIGDSAMWAQHDGPSVIENLSRSLANCGIRPYSFEQSRKDRIANYQEFRNRISAIEGEQPGFYTFPNSEHFWRTVPELQLDDLHPEKGPDTDQEDHCFPAGTKVITSSGPVDIDAIQTGDLVLTTSGFLPCMSLGKTSDNSQLFEAMLSDGYIFQATGNHPVLTSNGTYDRLDSLQKGDKLCVLKSYLTKSRDLTKRTTTYADTITKKMASDYTGLSGNSSMEVSQRGIMSTTPTEIGAITTSKTYLSLKQESTQDSTSRRDWRRLRVGKRLRELCDQLKMQPNLGIQVQRVFLGIARKLVKYFLQGSLASVLSAGMNILQSKERVNFALENVLLLISELEILDIIPIKERKPVYNLHVPGPNNFALENGLIVHNCYDETGYAIVSRPKLWTKTERINIAYDEAQRKARDADRGRRQGRSVGRYF